MLLKEKDSILVTSEQTKVRIRDGSILKTKVQQPKNSHCLYLIQSSGLPNRVGVISVHMFFSYEK